MHVDKITRNGYAVIVKANGGEEQLTILGTSRQDGRTAVMVVATSVDGDHRILRNGLSPTKSVLDDLRITLRSWLTKNAIGPDTDQSTDVERIIDAYDIDGYLRS